MLSKNRLVPKGVLQLEEMLKQPHILANWIRMKEQGVNSNWHTNKEREIELNVYLDPSNFDFFLNISLRAL